VSCSLPAPRYQFAHHHPSLNLLGVEVFTKQVIGDDRERLTDAIRHALSRADIVILSGGLGPTEDDVTRDAAAAALGRRLEHSPEQETILLQRFRQFNRPMAPNNLRQTFLIEAPKLCPIPTAARRPIRRHRARRSRPAARAAARTQTHGRARTRPRLKPLLPPQVIKVRTFRITGIGESDLDTLIAPVYTKYTNPVTTVLSSLGDLWVHLRAQCDTEAETDALLKEVGDPIATLLGTEPTAPIQTIPSNSSSAACCARRAQPSPPPKAALAVSSPLA